MLIEPAASADGPAILELLSGSDLPIDGLLDHLNTALVARLDQKIVGCAALELYVEGALLRSVAVAAPVRGTGVGQELTAAALQMAQGIGTPAVYLLTTTAERFFRRFGFTTVKRQDVPASVQESIEFRSVCPASAIVMRRNVTP